MAKQYRNVVRTKKMIRHAFIELLREKSDIEKISVNELVRRADLSKSTFYYHYEDIYAVAEEFEKELVDKLSELLDRIKSEESGEYGEYLKTLIEFLKVNEETYSKVIRSYSPRLFIERLKSALAKKAFEDGGIFSSLKDERERYVRIRFLANACVDTMVDYFKGLFDLPLERVGEIILETTEKL